MATAAVAEGLAAGSDGKADTPASPLPMLIPGSVAPATWREVEGQAPPRRTTGVPLVGPIRVRTSSLPTEARTGAKTRPLYSHRRAGTESVSKRSRVAHSNGCLSRMRTHTLAGLWPTPTRTSSFCQRREASWTFRASPLTVWPCGTPARPPGRGPWRGLASWVRPCPHRRGTRAQTPQARAYASWLSNHCAGHVAVSLGTASSPTSPHCASPGLVPRSCSPGALPSQEADHPPRVPHALREPHGACHGVRVEGLRT